MIKTIERSNTQKGIFYYLEFFVRSIPIFYLFARKIVRFTNIFEEDANGVKLLNFKKKKINIIDVGASDGIATKFFMNNLDVNKVYCFEPNKGFYKIIKKKFVSDKPKVIAKNFAIGNKIGKTKIYIPNYIFWGKLFPLVTYTFYDKKKCLEQIRKDFINHKKFIIKESYLHILKPPCYLKDIDLIKIDINGNEYDALLSLKKIINKTKPVLMIEGLDDMLKITNFLNKMNYKCYIYQKNQLKKKRKYQTSLNYYFLQKYHLKN